jgi:hypothetical protein
VLELASPWIIDDDSDAPISFHRARAKLAARGRLGRSRGAGASRGRARETVLVAPAPVFCTTAILKHQRLVCKLHYLALDISGEPFTEVSSREG